MFLTLKLSIKNTGFTDLEFFLIIFLVSFFNRKGCNAPYIIKDHHSKRLNCAFNQIVSQNAAICHSAHPKFYFNFFSHLAEV
jgi:hypothetical protein